MRALDEPVKPRSSGSSERPSNDESRAARERLGADFGQMVAALKRAAYLERRLLGLTIATTIVRAASIAAAIVAGIVVAGAAALLAIAGARRGVQLLTDGAWWADILLAVGLIAALCASVHFTLRAVHRSALARTRRELGASGAHGASPPSAPEMAP